MRTRIVRRLMLVAASEEFQAHVQQDGANCTKREKRATVSMLQRS